jgi:hypothetical protein
MLPFLPVFQDFDHVTPVPFNGFRVTEVKKGRPVIPGTFVPVGIIQAIRFVGRVYDIILIEQVQDKEQNDCKWNAPALQKIGKRTCDRDQNGKEDQYAGCCRNLKKRIVHEKANQYQKNECNKYGQYGCKMMSSEYSFNKVPAVMGYISYLLH